MTIYKKAEGKAHFLNAREVAPLKATEMMFANNTDASLTGKFMRFNHVTNIID